MNWWNVSDQLRDRLEKKAVSGLVEEKELRQELADLGFWDGVASARKEDPARALLALHEVSTIVADRLGGSSSPLADRLRSVKRQAQGQLSQELHKLNEKAHLSDQDMRVMKAGLDALERTSASPADFDAMRRWILGASFGDQSLMQKVKASLPAFISKSPSDPKKDLYRCAEDLVFKNDVEGLSKFLDEHPHLVFARDDWCGETLLHRAMYHRELKRNDEIHPSLQICQLLIERGASLDALDERLLPPEFHTYYTLEDQESWLLHQLGLDQLLEGQPEAIRSHFLEVCRWIPHSSSESLRMVLEFLKAHPSGREWAAANPNRLSIWLATAVRLEVDRTWVMEHLSVWETFLTPEWAMSACFSAAPRDWPELLAWLQDRNLIPTHYTLPLLGYTNKARQRGAEWKSFGPAHEVKNPIFATPFSQAMRLESLACLELLWNSSEERAHADLARLQDKQAPHSRIFWHWVEGRLQEKKLKGQVGAARLEASLNRSDWEEARQWMEKGFFPQDPNRWAVAALQRGQLGFFEFMWNSDLLDGNSDRILDAVVRCSSQVWAVDFLERLKESGVSLGRRDLLERSAKADCLLIGAYLAFNGARVDSKIPHAEVIDHLAGCLKSGDESEMRFRLALDQVGVAHLVGDNFIKGMKTESGGSLEGNTVPASLLLFLSGLRWVESRTKVDLSQAIDLFSRAFPYSLRMQDAHSLPIPGKDDRSAQEDYMRNAAQIACNVERELLSDLESLEEGQSFLLPMTWVTGNQAAHATALLFTKGKAGEIELWVSNTGQGAQHHPRKHNGGRLSANTLNRYRLTLEQLREHHLLAQVVEISAASPGLVPLTRPYGPTDFYAILAPFASPPEEDIHSGWRKTQLSGTCSFRSYCPLLHLILARSGLAEDDYKRVLDCMKEEGLSFAIEQWAPLIGSSPSLAKLFSIAAPHLYDTLKKRLAHQPVKQLEQRRSQLKEAALRLEEHLPPTESSHEDLSLGANFPTRKAFVQEGQRIFAETQPPAIITQPLQNAPSLAPKSACAVLDFAGGPKKLIDSLASLEAFAKTAPTMAHASIGSALRGVAHALLSDSSDLLSMPPEEAKQMIERLGSLFNLYAFPEDRADPSSFFAEYLVTSSLVLAVIWRLVSLIEAGGPEGSRLTDFTLTDVVNWVGQLEHMDRHVLLNGGWERDLILLNKVFSDTSSNPLFDFSSHAVALPQKRDQYKPLYALRQTATSGEHQYALAQAAFRPVSDWKEADAALEARLREVRSEVSATPVVDQNVWRANWMQAKGELPSHYYTLRNMALIVHLARSGYFSHGTVEASMRLFYAIDDVPSLLPNRRLDDARILMEVCYGDKRSQGSFSDSPDSIPAAFAVGADRRGGWFSFKLPQTERSQNEAISQKNGYGALDPENGELRSIRYAALQGHPFPTLAPGLLFDQFEGHWDRFTDPVQRLFFEYTLFTPPRLLLALRDRPELAKEGDVFFERARKNFEEALHVGSAIKGSRAAYVFLLQEQMRFWNYCLEAGHEEAKFAPLLAQRRGELRQLLDEPDWSEEERVWLHAAYADSFQVFPPGNSDEILFVLESLSVLRNASSAKGLRTLPPAFLASAIHAPFKHLAIWKQLLNDPEEAAKVCQGLLRRYNQAVSEKSMWIETQFPIYACREGDAEFQVNLLTGEVWKDWRTLSNLLPSRILGSRIYQAIYGKKVFHCTVESAAHAGWRNQMSLLLNQAPTLTVYQFEDDHGRVRCFDDPSGLRLERQFSGQWFRFVEDRNIPWIPPLAKWSKLSAWVSVDNPKALLLVDTASMKPCVQIHPNSLFTDLTGDISFEAEWVDLASAEGGKAIQAFDKDAVLLQEAKPNGPRRMRLQLPNHTLASGAPIEFERTDGLWTLRGAPHFALNHEQMLPDLQGVERFLILESDLGREAMIPLCSFSALKEGRYDPTTCMRVAIRKNTSMPLLSQKPDKNGYLAYLTLTHAKRPEDYQRAMQFLQGARRFERYSSDELRTLGMIFLSARETDDHTGYAYACRLMAAWLVQDNCRRNPLPPSQDSKDKKEPRWDSPLEDWERFWQSEGAKMEFKQIADAYFERHHHLPAAMRIEAVLSPLELFVFGLDRTRPVTVLEPPQPLKPGLQDSGVDYRMQLFDEPLDLRSIGYWKGNGAEFRMRSRVHGEFTSYFSQLLEWALSPDEKLRKRADHGRLALYGDPDPAAIVARAALFSALNGDGNYARCVRNILSGAETPSSEVWLKLVHAAKQIEAVLPAYPKARSSPVEATQLLPTYSPANVPKKFVERGRLPFTPSHSFIGRFERLFENAFELDPLSHSAQPKSFSYAAADPWLERSVEEFRQDYLLGAERNLNMPYYRLTGKVTKEKLVTTHRDAIQKQMEHYSQGPLSKARLAALDLANRLPEDLERALERTIEIESGRKPPLTIRDCVGLFLQGDEQAYRAATSLGDLGDIAELHQLIGDYLMLHNRVERYKAVLAALDRGSLQAVAEELSRLSQSSSYAQEEPGLAAALMVFEYEFGVVLRKDQIEGVLDMTRPDPKDPLRYRSCLVQRIQGGGKSFVFGPLLALLLADGYHLSVHVPPTAQVRTALYNMSMRSQQLAGQREHSFVFDDSPEKFTVEYLGLLRRTLEEAIVRREYVTVSKETLQALRCKYLKALFLNAQDPGKRAARQELKQILRLLRERGAFVFDELHLAFDPSKELNMPFGAPKPPERDLCLFLGRIVSFARAARGHDGELLLNVKNSPEQTPEQLKEMQEVIIALLLNSLRERYVGLDAFLRGDLKDIPESLRHPDLRQLAIHLTVAKQLLAGGWLSERLQLRVNEAHGLAPGSQPRVSIPFISNMNPAYGSEFSDEVVIVLNTFLAYLVDGLDPSQTRRFVELTLRAAAQEKRSRRESDQDLALEDTEVAKAFRRVVGVSLLKIDRDSPEDLNLVQQSLLSGEEEANCMLLDFVAQTELSKVELYAQQVSSNGQNVAGMGQSLMAYSGSVKKEMAPLGAEVKLEKGTDGQTVDLLIRQETKLHLVDGTPKSLLELLRSHPQKDKMRALIDVAAHFCGVDNLAAARMICETLNEEDSAAQGVLFFHPETAQLCWMPRLSPDEWTVLSGFAPEIIQQETGFGPAERFTYYDQDHITGTDIDQMADAVALLSGNEKTKLYEMCQGPRRMRGLDKDQRIVVALSGGAQPVIAEALGTRFEDGRSPDIAEFLLFSCICESNARLSKNLMLAMQKIDQALQQHVLDRLLELDDEEALFQPASFLYDKSTAVDYYRLYAFEQQQISMESFLLGYLENQLKRLQDVLSEAETVDLSTRLHREVLNEETLLGVPKTIDTPKESQWQPQAGRDSQHVQERVIVQEDRAEKVEERQQLQEQQRLVESKKDAKLPLFVEKVCSREDFPFPPSEMLGSVLEQELGLPLGIEFDPRIRVTPNASHVYEERTELLANLPKRPLPILAVGQMQKSGEIEWTFTLCSLKEAIQFDQWISEGKLPEGVQAHLLRPSGKSFRAETPQDLPLLPMVQLLLFAGDYTRLAQNPWWAECKKWIEHLPDGSQWANFLEKRVLFTLTPDYLDSKVCRLLNTP